MTVKVREFTDEEYTFMINGFGKVRDNPHNTPTIRNMAWGIHDKLVDMKDSKSKIQKI